MADPEAPTVEALRAHCRTRIGVFEWGSGDDVDYGLIAGSGYTYFARFRLDEPSPLLLVRIADDALAVRSKEYNGRVKKTEHMHWETEGWTWAEAPLDGSVPREVLLQLIDASHAMVYGEQDDHTKQFIALYESRPTMEQAFETLIDMYRLRHRHGDIRKLMQPAIRLVTTAEAEEDLAPAQSRIGGIPHFPASWTWPTFEGRPMAFLAQLNLAEIPAEIRLDPLPEKGVLYFFSMLGRQDESGDHDEHCCEGTDDPEISRVLLYEGDPAALMRQAGPDDIKTFATTAVSYHALQDLPSTDDHTRDPSTLWLEWPEEELDRLYHLDAQLRLLHRRHIGAFPAHQLLGYADSIQETVVRPGERLLFQLYSDDNADMVWGDGGTIWFVIREADLKERRFSAVRSDTQCG
jgi:uncharacterized protein YwqG